MQLSFDGSNFDNDLIKQLNKSDHILISIAPVSGEDIVIKNFKSEIEKANPKWMTYLSATSVYGDHKGAWVDEKSETKPTSPNGLSRLNAKNYGWILQKTRTFHYKYLKLSGIYSNVKNILLRIKSGEAKIINKKNHFFLEFTLKILQIFYLSLLKDLKQEKYIILLMISLLHRKKLPYLDPNY